MDKKPNNIILFFTYGVSLYRWEKTGIIDREVKFYQKLIQKYNINVTFITYGDDKDLDISKRYRNINVVPVYKRFRKSKNKVFRFLKSLIIPFYIKKEIKNADIIKTNQMWGSWVAVIAKFFFNKPLIIRCGWEKFYYNTSGYDYSNRFITWLISKVSYEFSDQIILTSSSSIEFIIEKFKINKEKINHLPNWIDTDIFFPSEKENKILFVGRLVPDKNPEMLLEVLKNTEMKLDILGSGYLKEKLLDTIKQSHINVSILPTIPNNKMPELYNKYSIYVICSDIEGNPKTLLEAMSCSCAVIGTKAPGIKNIINNNQSGILVNKNVNELRQKLKELWDDSSLRNSLGKKAREQIINNNSLDVILKKEYLIYDNIQKNKHT